MHGTKRFNQIIQISAQNTSQIAGKGALDFKIFRGSMPPGRSVPSACTGAYGTCTHPPPRAVSRFLDTPLGKYVKVSKHLYWHHQHSWPPPPGWPLVVHDWVIKGLNCYVYVQLCLSLGNQTGNRGAGGAPPHNHIRVHTWGPRGGFRDLRPGAILRATARPRQFKKTTCDLCCFNFLMKKSDLVTWGLEKQWPCDLRGGPLLGLIHAV